MGGVIEELHPLEQRVLLRQLLERSGLSKRQLKIAIARHAFDRVPQRELAAEIGLTATTVAAAEWRGMGKLRHHAKLEPGALSVRYRTQRQLAHDAQRTMRAELIEHWRKNYPNGQHYPAASLGDTDGERAAAQRRRERLDAWAREAGRHPPLYRRQWTPPPAVLTCVDCGATAEAWDARQQIGWTCDHDNVSNHCQRCNLVRALAAVRVRDQFQFIYKFKQLW
jgi:hypothetical protein